MAAIELHIEGCLGDRQQVWLTWAAQPMSRSVSSHVGKASEAAFGRRVLFAATSAAPERRQLLRCIYAF